MSIGHRIKELRTARAWTLEELSERSGVDIGTISALERRNSQKSQYFPAIANAFGLTVDQLGELLMAPSTDLEANTIGRKLQRDKWLQEGESILLSLNSVQRAQMVANMRSFKPYLDRN